MSDVCDERSEHQKVVSRSTVGAVVGLILTPCTRCASPNYHGEECEDDEEDLECANGVKARIVVRPEVGPHILRQLHGDIAERSANFHVGPEGRDPGEDAGEGRVERVSD